MNNSIKAILAITLLSVMQTLRAQCPTHSFQLLDANRIKARINNGANQFWDMVGYPTYQYQFPVPHLTNSLFAAAPWVGGLDAQGALHVAASTYAQGGNDFYSGPVRQGFAYNCGKIFQNSGYQNIKLLGSGKLLLLQSGGFEVLHPTTLAATQVILPTGFQVTEHLELPNGNLMILGWTMGGALHSQVMVFDTSTFFLSQPDTLQYGHEFPAMALLPSGNVLVASNMGVELYQPTTGTSQQRAPFGVPRRDAAIVTLPSGQVLSAGGNLSTVSEIYDPGTNTWTTGPSMTYARLRNAEFITMPNGEIYLYGGTQLVERFDPGLQQFLQVGSLASHVAAYASMVNDSVLLVGHGLPSSNFAKLGTLNLRSGVLDTFGFPPCQGPVVWTAHGIASSYYDLTQVAFLNPDTRQVINARWDHVWKVTRIEVQAFLQDFATQQLDFSRYPDILTWPGNGNPWAGEDWQLAPYVDVDFDGNYDPAGDGDYPCFPGDQGIWWVFHDDGPHTETGSSAMGLQFENLAWAVDCSSGNCPDSSLDVSTFYHTEITNRGSLNLHDVAIGMFVDAEIGNYADDYIGSDSLLGLAYWYNGDANDDGAHGYGLNPPAAGLLALPNSDFGELAGMIYYENDFTLIGNPVVASDYYGYLQQQWKDGSHLVNNGGNGYPGSLAGPSTNFAFSGDGGFCGGNPSGWTELGAGNQPFDRRIVANFGLVDLAPGESVSIDYAIVWARDSSHLRSVCQLKLSSAAILDWWAQTADRSCLQLVTSATGADQKQESVVAYPNPSIGNYNLVFSGPLTKIHTLEVMDLQGRVVWMEKVPVGTSEWSFSLLYQPAGIYLAKIGNTTLRLGKQ